MKVKQKLEKPKGKKDNVLRGPKTPKKMKLANKLPKKPQESKDKVEPVKLKTPVKAKTQSKTRVSITSTLDITPKMIQESINALLKLNSEHRKKSKALLLSDKENIFLQMVFMRKPEVPEPRRKFLKLHHGVHGEAPEVCLFVADRIPKDRAARTPDEKIEYSVEYYEEMLKNHQVEGITTIMPCFQFKTEFDRYELRRKLVDRFDIFLCQSTLLDNAGYLKNLGIAWTKKNKVPLPVKFPNKPETNDPKLKEHISELLRTTWFSLKPHGDTVAIRVGTTGLSAEQLNENVSYVLHQLKEANVVPGGVANIKGLYLKTSLSKVLPLYINLASPNSVPVPVLPSIRGIPEAVEDELSTLPGKKVTVLPSGDVFITADPDHKVIPEWQEELTDEEADFFDDEEAKEDSSDDEDIAPKKKPKLQEESEDSDKEADDAEQQYLASWNKEAADKSSDEEVEKILKKKTNKSPQKKGKKQAKVKLQEKKKSADAKTKPQGKKITVQEKGKAQLKKSKEAKKPGKELPMKKSAQKKSSPAKGKKSPKPKRVK